MRERLSKLPSQPRRSNSLCHLSRPVTLRCLPHLLQFKALHRDLLHIYIYPCVVNPPSRCLLSIGMLSRPSLISLRLPCASQQKRWRCFQLASSRLPYHSPQNQLARQRRPTLTSWQHSPRLQLPIQAVSVSISTLLCQTVHRQR